MRGMKECWRGEERDSRGLRGDLRGMKECWRGEERDSRGLRGDLRVVAV